jgi:hypothetical protein
MPIISIQTLREKVSLQFTQQRLIARLTSFFGVLSLILASAQSRLEHLIVAGRH